jgi:hypothetical protein
MFPITARLSAVVFSGVAASIALAGPATADTNLYLHELQVRYANLTTDQLMWAGRTVCDAASRGIPSSDSVVVVQRHLAVTVPAAADIVAYAVADFDC